ncbi:MAG: hypothetical protein WCG80_13920 [Spirochaetales bacterium]
MKSLFDDLPRFCPVCGQPQDFDAVRRTAYLNGYAQYCSGCRNKYQYVERHVTEEKLFDQLDPVYTAP